MRGSGWKRRSARRWALKAARLDLPFLGRIPLSMAVRTASDEGEPIALGDTPEGNAFRAIAAKLADALAVQGA